MPLLIYCRNRTEVAEVVASMRRQTVVAVQSGGQRGLAIDAFVEGAANVLVATITSIATGWRAPPGTIVLFTAAVEADASLAAHRKQAAARVGVRL